MKKLLIECAEALSRGTRWSVAQDVGCYKKVGKKGFLDAVCEEPEPPAHAVHGQPGAVGATSLMSRNSTMPSFIGLNSLGLPARSLTGIVA